jgi:hypothetical protein
VSHREGEQLGGVMLPSSLLFFSSSQFFGGSSKAEARRLEHGKEAFAFARRIVQKSPTEFWDLHSSKTGTLKLCLKLVTMFPAAGWSHPRLAQRHQQAA